MCFGPSAPKETATKDTSRKDRIDNGKTEPPKREHIAMWTVEAIQSISIQSVRNSWHYRNFGWFPEEIEET